ncbi:MAG: DUF4293 domain-containing protein [Flavobacteriales bacterium]|nr:DUF4293 domain-containing protein [Flavobacteriales bacterium]
MIQRVQSIYLFLAALMSGLTLVFPFAAVATRGDTYILDLWGVHLYVVGHQVALMEFWTLALTIGLACATSLVTIFLFKKRKLQITICKLNLLLYLGAIFTIFYSGDNALDYIQNLGLKGELSYKLGAILPILSVILVFLASRAIKKDEDLVRSADRIR